PVADSLQPATKLAIRGQALAAGLGNLDEDETFLELRVRFEQSFDRQEFLDETFRVVESIDPDADDGVWRQAKLTAQRLAALGDRTRVAQPPTRVLHRDRIRAHERASALMRDEILGPIDSRVQHALGGVHETIAVVRRLESDDGAAEETFEQLPAPGTGDVLPRARPRNVPEGNDGRKRQPVANHARRDREVIILDEHERLFGDDLVTDGIDEARIHRPVHRV